MKYMDTCIREEGGMHQRAESINRISDGPHAGEFQRKKKVPGREKDIYFCVYLSWPRFALKALAAATVQRLAACMVRWVSSCI